MHGVFARHDLCTNVSPLLSVSSRVVKRNEERWQNIRSRVHATSNNVKEFTAAVAAERSSARRKTRQSHKKSNVSRYTFFFLLLFHFCPLYMPVYTYINVHLHMNICTSVRHLYEQMKHKTHTNHMNVSSKYTFVSYGRLKRSKKKTIFRSFFLSPIICFLCVLHFVHVPR